MFRRLIHTATATRSRSGIHTAIASRSRSGSEGRNVSQVSKPPTQEAYKEFGEFLWMVMLRLDNRVLGQAFKVLGNSDLTTRCLQGYLLHHRLKYTEIVGGQFPRLEKPLGFDDIGDYPVPYTHMIKLVDDVWEDAKRDSRGEPPLHYCTREETRLVHDFCRSLACRAEKEVFSGEPNVHELQEQARLFGAECWTRFLGLQSSNLTILIEEQSSSYATPVVPCTDFFSNASLTKCARSIKLAQEVADAGGLPQFPDHGGLVALYNFEKKHAYQLLLNCLKHIDKGYDERNLLWSSFENQQFYTVDVQVPGLSSLDQVHVEKHGRGVLVSTEMDVYRPEKLAVPPYANVDGLIANLQDEILTIRLPRVAAALEGTTSTVPIEDRDEAELDTTTSKRLQAAIVDDKLHHILRVEVPGVSREEVIVDNTGPELVVKTTANVFQQTKFKLPSSADVKQARASFWNGLLTIRVPKSATDTRELDATTSKRLKAAIASITTFLVSKFQACRKRLVARGSDCGTERLPAKEV
ncbi:uncharacterized protein LOC9652417 isoform X3 [Selaginella moellendorffii]|uniref:uncharacterized protein LOC9652417 isoform X3 n=1 Tax=Selaginella moellendorffii TaxID=88036 RepID=UPI000D1D0EEF|nr:uncharacterized protein LOC9652417 isoform X3 [Selaginella moellendorffii]|eukprot:XP_024522501.1 uncharacterized protein LOC9652417 isoform X3 [Selaginella moellendorffii]